MRPLIPPLHTSYNCLPCSAPHFTLAPHPRSWSPNPWRLPLPSRPSHLGGRPGRGALRRLQELRQGRLTHQLRPHPAPHHRGAVARATVGWCGQVRITNLVAEGLLMSLPKKGWRTERRSWKWQPTKAINQHPRPVIHSSLATPAGQQ